MLSEPPRSPYKEWYQTHQYFWFLHCRHLWSRRDGRSHLHSQHKSFPSESSYCVLGRCYPDAMHYMFRMVKWALLWTAAYKCVHVLPLELKLHLRTMYLESYLKCGICQTKIYCVILVCSVHALAWSFPPSSYGGHHVWQGRVFWNTGWHSKGWVEPYFGNQLQDGVVCFLGFLVVAWGHGQSLPGNPHCLITVVSPEIWGIFAPIVQPDLNLPNGFLQSIKACMWTRALHEVHADILSLQH